MTRPIVIERLNLEGLTNFIEKYNVSIPEFQRGYVWKEKQVRDLFDSLVKKYPIGSFIIWKTKERIGQRSLFVKEPTKSKQKYLILDGQQRLLSLYYLCKQNEFVELKSDFHEVCENKPLDFEHFYFNNKTRPKLSYSKDRTSRFDFEGFKTRLGKKYIFPVIIVSIDNYQKAQEIFERINQRGTPISTEAIFLSEAWNKKTNLGKILRSWRSESKTKVSGKLDNTIFIHTLAIIIQLEQIGDNNDEYNPGSVDISLRQLKKIAGKTREAKTKLYERELKKVLKSITEAMSFLEREYKIKKINELPSQTMVSILSVFFYYCDDPNKKQIKELKKWFWRSSLGGRYVGSGYNKNVRKDPIKMKELAMRKKPLNIPAENLEFSDLKDEDMHAGRSTIRNSLKLMLWSKEPQGTDGIKINREEIESRKRKKEDDHFYPYNLVDKGIIESEEVNSILNLCFLSKTENAGKGKDLPSKWLEKRKTDLKNEDEKRFFSSNLLPFKSIKELKRLEAKFTRNNGAIKSSRLFKEHYEEFLEQRSEKFQRELKRLQRGL